MNLIACSSGRKAPLETRDGSYVRQAAAVAPLPGDQSYQVVAGDTLYAIAWRSNNDFRSLARWNGIDDPYTIYVGQVLRLTPPAVSAKPLTSRPVISKQASSPVAPPSIPPAQRAAAPAKSSQSKTDPQPARPSVKTPAVAQPPPSSSRSTGALAWQWPVAGRVASTFKAGDTLRKGIKVAGKEGDSVVATESGKVVYSGSGLIGYGRLIIVKHNDKFLSAYGHNRKLLVNEGQQVTKGQKIAELGRSNDGKPMLHFEIRRNGKPVNPLKLLPRR